MSEVKLIQSKVFVFSICLIILISGIFSLSKNNVQLLPDVEPPKISFSVFWPGASENFIISEIVKPYEDSILGKLNHFESLKVTTKSETATFEVTFSFGSDLDKAEKELSSLLTRVRTLPSNVTPITFRRGGTNVSNRVVGSYFITSDSGFFSEKQLGLINTLALNKFKMLKGVESVELNPTLDKQLQITLDMNQLYQRNLSFEMVRNIVSNILDQPVIRLYEKESVITAKFKQTDSLEDIRRTPISYVNGVPILLQDVAVVLIEPVIKTATARYNGQEAISMRILRENGANLLDVQHLVNEVLELESDAIQAHGITYLLSFDTSLFIKRAIVWILGSLATGFLLTLVVSYIFFRRIYPTLLGTIITVLSTCGIFSVLAITNTSINVISLAGIAFASGMFVDGVLIFIEHLDRMAIEDRTTLEKIRLALGKLAPALFASTLTTVIVFLPVLIHDGVESQLFKGLALAITSGLLFSFILTLLITPFFAQHFLPYRKRVIDNPYPALIESITSMLSSKKRSALVFCILLLSSGVLIFALFPQLGYLPTVKRDAVDVYISIPGSNRLESIEKRIVEPLNNVLKKVPEIVSVKNDYVIGWPFFVTAAVRVENRDNIHEVINYLNTELRLKLPKMRVVVMQGELLGGFESNNNIEVDLYLYDKTWLSKNIAEVYELFKDTIPSVSVNITPNIESNITEYEFTPNIMQLRNLELNNDALKNIVKAVGKSDFIGKWSYGGDVLNAYLSMSYSDSNINGIPYVASNGVRTFVGELISMKESQTLPSLIRINGMNAAKINLRINDPELTVSAVMADLKNKLVPKMKLMLGDKGFISVAGSAASLSKAKLFLLAMFVFSIMAFLIIVALLLKSLRTSFYVLISLIPSLAGSILGFYLLSEFYHSDFNILTMLGFVITLGIVANNSILLVDEIQRCSLDVNIENAIVMGIRKRIRGITISSVTTVLGMLPLLFFPSDASSVYQGIAAVIIGGMIVNLITVLFITASTIHLFGIGVKTGESVVPVICEGR
ncbi:efflux RND transporter permease subunit [Shewanella sp.]|uniref:efflux RND transporter permease subunit n=3 Tax=Shewanella sp. TaxID=50422 RepID=UPI004053ACFE